MKLLALGLVVVASVACKRSSEPEVVPAPTKLVPTEAALRTNNQLIATDKGGPVELSDAMHKFHVTLPAKATITGELVQQSGVQVFNAQAVSPGGDVDVQFGVATVADGELPAEMTSMLASLPSQLATQAGGAVAKNEAGRLADRPSRVFEITTSDKRRLFGWYVAVAAQGRMYQINCVGPEGDKTRTACSTIASSLSIQ